MTFGFGFCSVLYGAGPAGFGSVRVLAHFFYFRVPSLFYSWQNLGSGSGRSCWVRVVSRFYFVSSNLFESYNMNREGALTAGVALYGGYSLLVVR